MGGDVRLTAEEILELDDDKDGEEQYHAAQHDGCFGKAQEGREERFLFTDQLFVPAVGGRVQEDPCQQVRAGQDIHSIRRAPPFAPLSSGWRRFWLANVSGRAIMLPASLRKFTK